jgi:hypothetical protein
VFALLGNRLIAALLIAMWFVTPDMLCLLPGVEMTVEQHKCCEQMGPDCGKAPMPDMDTCCRTATPPPEVLVAKTTDYPELRATLLPAITPDLDPHNRALSIHWLRFESPTPPPLLSRDSFEILRV